MSRALMNHEASVGGNRLNLTHSAQPPGPTGSGSPRGPPPGPRSRSARSDSAHAPRSPPRTPERWAHGMSGIATCTAQGPPPPRRSRPGPHRWLRTRRSIPFRSRLPGNCMDIDTPCRSLGIQRRMPHGRRPGRPHIFSALVARRPMPGQARPSHVAGSPPHPEYSAGDRVPCGIQPSAGQPQHGTALPPENDAGRSTQCSFIRTLRSSGDSRPRRRSSCAAPPLSRPAPGHCGISSPRQRIHFPRCTAGRTPPRALCFSRVFGLTFSRSAISRVVRS